MPHWTKYELVICLVFVVKNLWSQVSWTVSLSRTVSLSKSTIRQQVVLISVRGRTMLWPRDMTSPACCRSAQGSLPGWSCPWCEMCIAQTNFIHKTLAGFPRDDGSENTKKICPRWSFFFSSHHCLLRGEAILLMCVVLLCVALVFIFLHICQPGRKARF